MSEQQTAETYIRNGTHYYICETCNHHNKVDMPRTKCPECSAWYHIEPVLEVPGTKER